jgi:acetylornithine deacetylase/succinyl-diaminopimelate desuccinylase-like protein
MLLDKPPTRAVLTNTVNVTGFGGAQKPNVVPSETWAVLDCRTLPGQDPAELIAELGALVDDPQVRFEVMSTSQGSISPVDDPFFRALAAAAVEGRDDAVAGPVLSVGYTDSNALRPLGVRAYGFVPVVVDAERLGTMHGDDERIRLTDIRDGLRVLLTAVATVSLGP